MRIAIGLAAAGWACSPEAAPLPRAGGGLAVDAYLYSFFTESTVVEIARTGSAQGTPGETVWWAGFVGDGFAFDPSQARFYWQHGVSYTDDGTLLVSGFSGSTFLLEYAVVPEARTLELVWSNDAGRVAHYGGDAERLPNGNTLHLVGSAGVVREVDPLGAEVWRLSYGDGRLLGSGELVEDLYALVAPPP